MTMTMDPDQQKGGRRPRLASNAIVADESDAESRHVSAGQATKRFSAEEFRRVMRSSNFVGSVSFWRALERLADPECLTRFHAMGFLQELGQRSLEDCEGLAYSPQHAACLEYCGFPPDGVRPPGSSVIEHFRISGDS